MSVRSLQVLLVASAFTAMLVIAGGQALSKDAHPSRVDGATRPQVFTRQAENKASTENGETVQGRASQKETLCLAVESAARANDLPLEFFARVIWQESRFRSNAIGPITRDGQRALGIAQFMPETAKERGLLDPFDPVQALPKAAAFLNELRNQFGNLGLAAAAYNAGPARVQEWLAGSGSMPQETRDYVQAITGTSVEDWLKAGKRDKVSEGGRRISCRQLIALLERAPNRFVARLEQRVTRAVVKPWGVQVAAGFNRNDALAMYARAMKKLAGVMGNRHDPLLFHVRGTSSFFQVRIGANTRHQADDLCRRIRHAGVACLVKRRGA